MWKAWLAQTDGSVVVETMDASQDARLRLIVASLILLFGIAITLVIVALSRGRKKNVSGAREPAEGSQSSQQKPVAAPNTGPKAIPAAASSRPVTAPQPRLAGNSEAPESLASDESASAAQVPAPPAKAAARATNPMTATTRSPVTSEKVNPAKAHAPLPSSPAPATPPKSPLSTFDPQEYKKTLARIDPEKKRQEILQRLAEIQKDTKNAEARAAVRLPSVTAAPRPVNTLQSEPASSAASQYPENRPPVTHTPSPLRELQIEEKERPLGTEIAPEISKPDTREATPKRVVTETEATEEPKTLPELPETINKQQSPTQSNSKSEDFSLLSSIQRRLAHPPPRMTFRDWLGKIELEG